jgi:RNA polymerase sigma factor (sigma-70 family)
VNPFDHSTQIQRLLDSLAAGDMAAADRLVERSFERVRILARRMFHRQHADLRAFVETDDVLNAAALRLHRSIQDVRPESVRNFFALANTQVRRELIDLARKHVGQDGVKARRVMTMTDTTASGHRPIEDMAVDAGEPQSLEDWADFHETAAKLPENEREVFELLWYQGLSQDEAAEILGIAVRTVRARWLSAKLLISERLHGERPS